MPKLSELLGNSFIGDQGIQGVQSTQGLQGFQGDKAGLKYVYSNSVNTGLDPGNGNLRLNDSTFSSVTKIAIHTYDTDGADLDDYLSSWDQFGDSNYRGLLLIKSNINSDGTFALFKVTGTEDSSSTSWKRFTLSHTGGNTGSISNYLSHADKVVLEFIPAGAQGTQGLQGNQGNQGLQGVQSLQGLQGVQGVQALQGLQGVQGVQGVQNLQGNQGRQGRQGIQGNQGLQGPISDFQGTQGTQGVQGMLSDFQGTQGVQSAQGPQGVQNLQGNQGNQALQGTEGQNSKGLAMIAWLSPS